MPQFLKLFKHILVVQQCVRELFTETVGLEVILDSRVDAWQVKDLMDGGSCTLTFGKAHGHNVFEVGRIFLGQGRVLAIANAHAQLNQTLLKPRCPESCHFVKQDAQRPNVTFLVVRLRLQ